MTNAEWLKALVEMNPGTEEIAQVISEDRLKCRFCVYLGDPYCAEYPGHCREHIRKWLEAEAQAELDAFAAAQGLKEKK